MLLITAESKAESFLPLQSGPPWAKAESICLVGDEMFGGATKLLFKPLSKLSMKSLCKEYCEGDISPM